MKKQTVHLYVFDSMSDWEYGYLVAGLNTPQFQQAPGRYQVKTVGATDAPVKTAGGLRIVPDLTLDELTPAKSAMLVLPGGASWDRKKNKDAARLAGAFLASGTPVAAICGATAGLARAGLLDDVPHTSNSKDYLAATGYQGEAFYKHKPAVRAGRLITASAMRPLEFAREVFSLLEVYAPATLAAWYGLYKTGDAKYFEALIAPAD
ncbi:MAG: glutamine amidotransferase [Variovorax sp.]|nr:MAG: glutamine amidotransferase [Variovorax sp.]